MTAPDYGKCWLCGRTAGLSDIAGYCLDAWCQASCGIPKHMWRAIHDRLAAVREEERERCAKQIDKDIDELFDYPGPERAIGHTLADLVRKGE